MPIEVLRSRHSYGLIFGALGLLAVWVSFFVVLYVLMPSTQGLILPLLPGALLTNILALLGPVLATIGFVIVVLFNDAKAKGAGIMLVGTALTVPFDMVGGFVIGLVLLVLSVILLMV